MTNEIKAAEQTLEHAIRHIRRTHMNTRNWFLPLGDSLATDLMAEIMLNLREFDRINHGPEVSPFDEMAAYQPGRGVHGK